MDDQYGESSMLAASRKLSRHKVPQFRGSERIVQFKERQLCSSYNFPHALFRPFSADKVAIRRPVSCALVPTLSWPGAQGDNGGNLSSCSLRPCMVPYCFVVEASTYYGMSLITTHLAIGS